MSASQLLNLVIQATDRASPVIGGVERKLKGVTGAARSVEQSSGAMSNAIAFGMVKAQAAIGLVETGFSKLQQSIQQSARIELDNLSSAAGLETMLGSFDAAAGFIDGMNAKLAKAAAALPGETAQYAALARTISDDVGGAFADANGKIKDVAGFEKTLTSISSSYSAMAATTGVSAGNMQLLMMRMVGGSASMREMSQIDALQNNPTLKRNLESALKQAGVAELKDLDLKSRIKLIDEIGKKVITPEFIKRSESTLEGLTQSFKSNLFDPSTGIFGLMRDLDEKTKGNQTAYESIKRLTATVIGSGGLFDTIGKILQQLGLTADPMVVLRDGVETLNGWLTNINKALKGFKPMSAEDVGKRLAEFTNWLFSGLIKAVAGADYKQIGGTIGTMLGNLFKGLGSFLANLDIKVYAGAAAALLGVAAVNIVTGLFAAIATSSVTAVAMAAVAVMPGVAGVFAAVMGGFATVATAIGAIFAAAPAALWIAAAAALVSIAKFGQAVVENIEYLPKIFEITFQEIGAAVWPALQPIVEWVKNLGQTVWNGIKGAIDDMVGAVSWLFEQAKNAVMSHPLVKAGVWVAEKAGIAPKYAGHIPNAASGLFSSLSAEMARMPAGATPVIANTSEAILTPSQLRNLVNGSASAGAARSSGGNTITISPTFTINGASDPETTARQVMRYMEILLEEHMQGAIA